MTLSFDGFSSENTELTAIDVNRSYGDLFIISATPTFRWDDFEEETVDENGEYRVKVVSRPTDEVTGYEVVLYASADGGANITVHVPATSDVLDLADKHYNQKVRLVNPHALFWRRNELGFRGATVTVRGIKTFADDVVLLKEKAVDNVPKEKAPQKQKDQMK